MVGPAPTELVGTSAHTVSVRERIDRWRACEEPVLIVGESGTGKEVAARSVHANSARADKPLHVVNCAGLAEDVLMAELFGHVRGAYTGALASRQGRLRRAEGATLLLDEVTEAPAALQSALLRVLEHGEIQPVGSDTVEHIDVRLIATTNRSAQELADGSALRADLRHRLGALVLRLAPLRHRPEDIAPLADLFLDQLAEHRGMRYRLSTEGLRVLTDSPLAGNARELRQVLVRASIDCPDGVIHALAVTEALRSGFQIEASDACGAIYDNGATLADVIRRHLSATLDATGGNLSEAARRLDIPRSTLQHHLARYAIERPSRAQSRTRSA
ncbi:MAG: AAA domain-containing protein [Acidobacteria bacterium]|nr:AAA domain-containing protein [Acidobacteriota bacterium]